MSQTGFEPAKDAPRLTREAAIQYFLDGIKPLDQARVGVESEIFLVEPDTLAMLPFDAIERFLQRLADLGGWQPIAEAGRVVALRRGGAMVALEPGGQLEFASEPLPDLHALQQACDHYFADVRAAALQEHCAGLSVGMHPTADFARVPLVPKSRYGIMAPRLAQVGALSHVMMRGTASWQCALDYHSEADWRQKFRAAYHVTSIVSALFANSAWEGGASNGFVCKRLVVWLHTDPARCGLLPLAFDAAPSFESYCDYACAVPLLFINRSGQWVEVRDRTFGEFLRSGYNGFDATLEDWELHLTTLFPEVRLKRYIELRGTDANRPDLLPGFAGIYLGLFAESSLLDAACDLTRALSFTERMDLHLNIARDGLAARCGKIPVRDLAQELLAIAREGLVRRSRGEAALLEPVEALVQTPAGARVASQSLATQMRPYLIPA